MLWPWKTISFPLSAWWSCVPRCMILKLTVQSLSSLQGLDMQTENLCHTISLVFDGHIEMAVFMLIRYNFWENENLIVIIRMFNFLEYIQFSKQENNFQYKIHTQYNFHYVYLTFYTPVFRRDVLWYSEVYLSVLGFLLIISVSF
jgi:hypothetical protein